MLKKILLIITLFACGLTFIPQVMAQSAQSIEDRIKRLENMVGGLHGELVKARTEIAELKKSKREEAQPKNDSEKDYEIKTDTGLAIHHKDGSHFKFGGRIQTDYNFSDGVFNQKGGGNSSEGELRRVRLGVEGAYKHDWKYKLTVDINDQDDEASVDEGYIQYVGFKPFAVTVGKAKEPFSLERQTSSKWISTIERNMIINSVSGLAAGQPDFAGIMLSGYHQDWYHLNWAGGIFDDGHEDANGDDSYAFTGRITVAPQFNDHLVHLGLAYSRRDLEGKPNTIASRLGIHTAARVTLGSSEGVDDVDQIGVEAAYQYKAFSVQGEYYDFSMDGAEDLNNLGTSYNDLDLDGYYVQAAYTLTGEPRTYKFKGAKFDRIKPQGKYGAWELVARFETMEVDDNQFDDIEADKYTLGVNWYFNDHVKLMANYINAELDNYAGDAQLEDEIRQRGGEDDGDAFSLRMQYVW